MSNFYRLEGMLRVEAAGYWYTSGGEKGSFGYYPHLKDEQGFPVYPDTQLHGDLRMAALWGKELGIDGNMLDRIFGRQGNETAGLLKLGDLTLDNASRKKWQSAERFNIKPRIEIDDESRSVKKGMLANFEAAWLDRLTLEAPLSIGCFGKEEETDAVRDLLGNILPLLSGFGALRSRGYGRVKLAQIDWKPVQCNRITGAGETPERVSLSITAFNHLRSKPVAAEQLQLVASRHSIAADQFRGWLVRTYHDLTGDWPTADQMASIIFSDFHPSPNGEMAWPPPVTTLRKEDGSSIEDYWGKNKAVSDESFLRIKDKPLKAGSFVTANGIIHSVLPRTRMRNAMEDAEAGGTFKTRKEGGLFVQQFLPAGNVFTGTVHFSEPSSEFSRLAFAILTGVQPEINGTLFTPRLIESVLPEGEGPLLATMPLPWDPARNIVEGESLSIGTVRRYAPALRRPRRGRPAIMPGSVILDKAQSGAVAWPMFGKPLPVCFEAEQICAFKYSKWIISLIDELEKGDKAKKWKNMTRSQAGILRELLNPDHNDVSIPKYLAHIHDKHKEKHNSSETMLYGRLLELLESEGLQGLRTKITELLEYLKVEVWWEQRREKGGDSR